MSKLYFWPSTNGIKITILLEELGVTSEIVPLNIRAGEQKNEEFKRINPNQKIPAWYEEGDATTAPLAIFESGAILLYLAEKHGRFLPREGVGRYAVLQWLIWHSAQLSPALSQYQRFRELIPEQIGQAQLDAAIADVKRQYAILDAHFAQHEYLADEYSIADIAVLPWIQPRRQGQQLADYPHLAAWFERVHGRAAVQKAYAHGRSISANEKALADWR
ncbi:glutathione S-transferase family protein [Uliginosibacterium gangwonense]|uniref:glutathione S-transferase family protein n=1 Tax=Uliginosibacterium gangwonense TaxID=392736 RepID=UPI000374ED98|nr:glutathione binding-like protein [Uliginosibacterium gangwonense]